MFFLGLVIGLLISILLFVILAFFRVGVERQVRIIERRLEEAGTKPQGFIIEPEDEADLARQELIKQNDKMGKPTKLADLYKDDKF
jgi:hypothetical protein